MFQLSGFYYNGNRRLSFITGRPLDATAEKMGLNRFLKVCTWFWQLGHSGLGFRSSGVRAPGFFQGALAPCTSQQS